MDAQLLFSVVGEGLARLDIGDNTTSASPCSFIFSVSTDVSVFILFLFLYISTC
jgi:hypothetical protein